MKVYVLVDSPDDRIEVFDNLAAAYRTACKWHPDVDRPVDWYQTTTDKSWRCWGSDVKILELRVRKAAIRR